LENFLNLAIIAPTCASAPAATPTIEAPSTSEAESIITVTPVIGDTTPIVPIATSTVPFDALFIDTLTALAANTSTLLQSALTSGEHDELTTYAQGVIDAQATRTQQMSEWRASWYPDVETSTTLLTNYAHSRKKLSLRIMPTSHSLSHGDKRGSM
jgi:uncharacterized protein (DUF305 family)